MHVYHWAANWQQTPHSFSPCTKVCWWYSNFIHNRHLTVKFKILFSLWRSWKTSPFHDLVLLKLLGELSVFPFHPCRLNVKLLRWLTAQSDALNKKFKIQSRFPAVLPPPPHFTELCMVWKGLECNMAPEVIWWQLGHICEKMTVNN